ncbi:DUF1461 domain-containing protein [Candidatus Woesearchaeota archaeon]|nr:DUF1461 domain-containing protein [Candidatus Woesearchaeota archaeon]
MNKKRVLMFVFIVLVPFFLILFSYKVVFNFTDYNVEQREVVNFLEDKGKLTAEMSDLEASHLEDVQGVLRGVDYLFYSLLLICTLILTYNYGGAKKLLFYGGIATAGWVGLTLLFVFFDFNLLFDIFHKVLFPGGNWIFSQDSFLIQTFPLTFFISAIKKIVYLSLILASVFILGGIYLRYAKKD